MGTRNRADEIDRLRRGPERDSEDFPHMLRKGHAKLREGLLAVVLMRRMVNRPVGQQNFTARKAVEVNGTTAAPGEIGSPGVAARG